MIINSDENALEELQKAKLLNNNQKFALTYAFAFLMINITNLPENKQYILYVLSRVASRSLIELAEEFALRKFDFSNKIYCYNFSSNFFSYNFLEKFSNSEKEALHSALKQETIRSRSLDRNYEYLYNQILDWVKVCSFFFILHNKPFSNIAAEPNATIYNFALASFVALSSYHGLQSLKTKPKIAEIEISDDADLEVGDVSSTHGALSSEHQSENGDLSSTYGALSLEHQSENGDLSSTHGALSSEHQSETGNRNLENISHSESPISKILFTEKNRISQQIKKSSSYESFLKPVEEKRDIKRTLTNPDLSKFISLG